MAIVTYPLNGIDYDAENAETYLCTRTSGVYSAENNFSASVTGGRQVSISKGLAWIQNTKFAGKSVCNTESVAIEIPISDGTRPRIDRIVLRFDKAANASSIVLKQGTPSSAPAAPAVERTELVYELGLCTVLVPAASTIVDAGDVTSTLLDESVCGLMRDGVTGIPTDQLQAQTQAIIDELREVIAGIEQGSEVMLKDVYVDGDDPQPVAKANSAPWSGITGKPGTYPPSAHTHDDRYYTESEIDSKLSGKANMSGSYPSLSVGTATNANYANSAGSARANNISMSLSGTTLKISYS